MVTPLLHTIHILTEKTISGPLRVLLLVRKSSKTFLGLENMCLALIHGLKET